MKKKKKKKAPAHESSLRTREQHPHSFRVPSMAVAFTCSDRLLFHKSSSPSPRFWPKCGLHFSSGSSSGLVPAPCFPPPHSAPAQVSLCLSRRNLFGILLLATSSSPFQSALADVVPGFRDHIDKLDGYSFSYPKGWIQVRGAGADVFFRDPVNLDENVSVEISSPSSSKFKGLDDLGSPDEAAKKVSRQYLTEFMSTRLGVRRESKIVSTASRVADDGKLYYDIEVNVKSYANNQQLAVMPQDRVVQMEWDRRYLSVLGVENNRLYELRLQAPETVLVKEENDLHRIMNSFRVLKL